jgi:hypothetical protein
MSADASERRASDRFPIVRDVRYKLPSSNRSPLAGTGQTINISSNGVLFSAQEPMVPGKRLELSISWPAQLDGKCGLKLVARGRVVRCRGTAVAIEIEKYEFRTQGSGALAALVGA